MNKRKLIQLLHIFGKLKTTMRHCWNEDGRQESVAEHSYRLSIMALFVYDEFPGVDLEKLLKMSLLHDLGEAVTGDIATFLKTEEDEKKEKNALEELLEFFPENPRKEYGELFKEMENLETEEAKLIRALDKLEALLSHNESSLDTWSDNEYALNLVYADDVVAYSEYLRGLREEIRKDTLSKIQSADRLLPQTELKNDAVTSRIRQYQAYKKKPS